MRQYVVKSQSEVLPKSVGVGPARCSILAEIHPYEVGVGLLTISTPPEHLLGSDGTPDDPPESRTSLLFPLMPVRPFDGAHTVFETLCSCFGVPSGARLSFAGCYGGAEVDKVSQLADALGGRAIRSVGNGNSA